MIREAHAEECEVLSQLALRSKAYWGYDAAFMAACVAELTLRPEELAQKPTWVLCVDERIVGFYRLAGQSAELVELDMLFVDTDQMGHGYGRQLYVHALAQVRARGYALMEIAADPDAVPFYERMGAKVFSQIPSGSIPGRMLPLMRQQLR